MVGARETPVRLTGREGIPSPGLGGTGGWDHGQNVGHATVCPGGSFGRTARQRHAKSLKAGGFPNLDDQFNVPAGVVVRPVRLETRQKYGRAGSAVFAAQVSQGARERKFPVPPGTVRVGGGVRV